MSYPAYPDCDTAEPDWLGAIPKQWSHRRLRFNASEPLVADPSAACLRRAPLCLAEFQPKR